MTRLHGKCDLSHAPRHLLIDPGRHLRSIAGRLRMRTAFMNSHEFAAMGLPHLQWPECLASTSSGVGPFASTNKGSAEQSDIRVDYLSLA